MTDYYVVDDKIYGHTPKVYTYSELIKALNNADVRWLLDGFCDSLTLYRNVSSLRLVPTCYGPELEIKCSSRKVVQDTSLNRLLFAANQWLVQFKTNESWDGQTNYLVQSNLLGSPVFIPFPLISYCRYGRHTMRHKSHSTLRFKSGRVEHTMSANARYTYRNKELSRELKDYPLTHRNRKDRRHSFRFPVFDDPEYCTSRHSTGWKYSTKYKRQYEIHV